MRIRAYFIKRISALTLFVSILIPAQPAIACAPAPRPGAFVRVAEESAIIVWDAASRVQHLIRRATFDADTPDFGFLVPTPTQPVLAEAEDEAFDRLAELMKPKTVIVERTSVDFTPLILSFLTIGGRNTDSARPPAAAAPPVRVLDSKRVAGYDAVVLEADDPRALAGWLKSHGYAIRPELTEWFAPYVAARWKITAFKIAKGEGAGRVSSSAVRMSFKTDRPFFPYREPSDQRGPKAAGYQAPRLLRVFMLSAARMDGTIGESSRWPGKTKWADRLGEALHGDLARELALGPNDLPATMWLTVFEDESSPRPGTDEAYFSASKDQSSVVPPPTVITRESRIPIPADVVLFILLVATIFVVMRRRRSRKLPNAGA